MTEFFASRWPVDNELRDIHRDDLQAGFIGKTCSFEHRPYAERSDLDRGRYDRLREHLLTNGMKNPIITHKGHVLLGMRRFEILKEHQEVFRCCEILEDVANFNSQDIVRLQNFNTELCGDEVPRF